MLGWLALVVAPLSPRWSDRIAAVALPLILSLAYAALIMAFWSGAAGGFDSLANVMVLFETPAIALAGWLHYLAFDLFIGAWQVRTARAASIPHADPALPGPDLPVRPGWIDLFFRTAHDLFLAHQP